MTKRHRGELKKRNLRTSAAYWDAVQERDSWFQYQMLAYSLTANHQVRLGKCSREFFCDLLKPAGLKDDLRLGVADDVAGKLFAFYD